MNDLSLSTSESNSLPQARATDPITSRLAALKVNAEGLHREILHYLYENGPADVYQIAQGIERKETSVSSAMPRLRRKGLVHEVGMAKSEETGMDRIVWENGPTRDFRGEENAMPVKQTGPRKQPKFDPFTCWAEIEYMWKVGGGQDGFIKELNAAIESRIS
jgi:DNA-binding Lrp family transcriptional regulator